MTGEHHFNEVVFDGVFVPDEQVVGTIGEGWAQVTSELAYERSGPERLLSTFVLLDTLVGELAARSGRVTRVCGTAGAVGRVVSRLWACRQMSLAVAGALAAGEAPEIAAALVKDVGTRLESEIIEVARMLTATLGSSPIRKAPGWPGCWRRRSCTRPGSRCAAAPTRSCAASWPAGWACGER